MSPRDLFQNIGLPNHSRIASIRTNQDIKLRPSINDPSVNKCIEDTQAVSVDF
jgi:hypothetical protein